MLRFNKKGQSTAEYAILIGLVIAAAIVMQTYVKRSMQGGVKFAVDKLKDGDTGTGQYEPYYLESDYTTTQKKYTDTEEMKANGEVERVIGVGDVKQTTRTGTQKITGVP